MPGRDVIVIGASAGGVEPMLHIARSLPADLPASIFIAVHTSPNSPGLLPQIIDRAGPLIARHPAHNERYLHGRIYVAPPDRHMLISDGRILLTHGPKENGFRPAVDPLFRTAARAAGARVVGVVLSGGLDDGAVGSVIIRQHGGVTIAQDPHEAIFPSMPQSAIESAEIHHVLPVAQMPAVLSELARRPIPEEDLAMARRQSADGQTDIAEFGTQGLTRHQMPDPPSGFTCPECGGALWQIRKENGRLLRFRCHVGHAYTAKALEAEQERDLEAALWSAVRALVESAELNRRLASRTSMNSLTAIRARYEQKAREAEERAEVIRDVITATASQGGPGEERVEAIQQLVADAASDDLEERGNGRGKRVHRARTPESSGTRGATRKWAGMKRQKGEKSRRRASKAKT